MESCCCDWHSDRNPGGGGGGGGSSHCNMLIVGSKIFQPVNHDRLHTGSFRLNTDVSSLQQIHFFFQGQNFTGLSGCFTRSKSKAQCFLHWMVWWIADDVNFAHYSNGFINQIKWNHWMTTMIIIIMKCYVYTKCQFGAVSFSFDPSQLFKK